MIDYNTFSVHDIDDAMIVLDEILDDLDGYGWLDVCKDDWWGHIIFDAFSMIKRWVKYKQQEYHMDWKALDSTWELDELRKEDEQNEKRDI